MYPFSSAVNLAVPIGTKERCWDLRDLLEYESHLVAAFLVVLGSYSDVTLFDCGADIGLFSSVVCARSDKITRVLAFEPNPKIQDVFRRNIEVLPNGEPHASAVSNYRGFGRLESPDYADGDHARYLAPAESGISVVTVDSFHVIGRDVAIKIDVEGGELDVLRGSENTIRNASRCTLTLEAHPRVSRRTGVSPSACMKFLESIRPFRFVIAETGRWVKAEDDVVHPDSVLNIIAVTA
jgi:FkbM family methyltransferase